MLEDYALTTLESLKRFMRKTDADIQTPIFTLYNNSSDATSATYQVSATSIRLVVVGGANADDTTLNFSNADKDTMTELVAYINGTLGKGWVAEVVANGSQASADLTITDSIECLLFAEKKIIYAPDNLTLEDLINSATASIENYCGRRFKKTVYTDELYDGNGAQYLFLKNFPVISVASIYYYYVDADDDLLDALYYKIHAEGGYIYRAAGWTEGDHNIKVTYTAGYDFSADGIPTELQTICNQLSTLKYENVGKEGIKSEKMGSYSVSYADSESDMPAGIKGKLARWRKLDVI